MRHEHDNISIKAVWGIVYPPNYIHPSGDPDYTEEGVSSGPEFEIIEFTADASTNALFVSTEEINLTQQGRYQITVYAQGVDGL